MKLIYDVILSLIIYNSLAEQAAQTDDRRMIDDGKKTILPVSDEHAMTMYQKWADSALSSFFSAFAHRNWEVTVSRLKKVASEREQRKARKELENDSEEKMAQMSSFAFQRSTKNEDEKAELDKAFKDPKQMDKLIEKKLKSTKMKPEGRLMQFVKDALKLAYSLSGKNTTNFEKKDMKFVSPRFFGVVKENKKEDEIDFLSPSLFSLHDEGEGIENLTSIPQLMRGFEVKDQQMWLDFILEAAGVTDRTNDLENHIEDDDNIVLGNLANQTDISKFRREDGHPLYFTKDNLTDLGGTEYEKQKVEYYQEFLKTMSKKQIAEMNTTGYSVMRKDQIDAIYGSASPYNNSDTHKFLSNFTTKEIHQQIPKDIAKIAEMESFKLRKKDVTLSPLVLVPLVLAPDLASQPIVLSPLLFTPVILSPALLGPVILSPWMFVPVIVSPRVLSPLIVSPFVLSPVVLSPLVLHPVILSPGVLDVAVLTPFVLSPLILSPLVFVPVILSPLVLSPLILSPAVGSPLVLSPFVLSPIILSPQGVSALFLSPYALSPIIASELILFAAVLSPSWLS
ncbi:unnamed protein product [Bursaphelenchus xylophilus]|uniref:(pine wood nematode) hypothetical protein n=1 Tax=Bursaphelenchus xylophilus TaxID=6326 RepID=A0A7I8WN84_BURXY|nr:unnamed protein product [Bursaphelenchus xylophilus]CAG9092913.1 unnamed protein product [Bursaphelenchus xylophilus]